jgi:hypothetical protein
VKPPSTGSATPVMNDASGDARNSAAAAHSDGRARRPSGCARSYSSRVRSGSGCCAMIASTIGVSTMPGQTALTRIPWGAQSSASARASWIAAPFVAQ